MIAGPKVYQDIQLHIKNKIENLEFNYDFITLLLREYQTHEKLFTYNKLQTSETTNIILQIFLMSIEYITFIEELRMHQKYEVFMRAQRKKKPVQVTNPANMSVLTTSLLETAL
jgi:hypothetical protein